MADLIGIAPGARLIICFLLTAVFVQGCATSPKNLSRQQLNMPEAEQIIAGMESRENMVRSFYSIGVVSVKGWLIDSDADILIAGVKDPFTMKIEITHSWGKPILHVLIKDNRLEVLSFQEKAIYEGAYSSEALSRFLPGLDLGQDVIWSILGSRPQVIKHDTIGEPMPGRIRLVDETGREVESIFLPVTKYIPSRISLPVQSLEVLYSEIREVNGVSYAGEMELKGLKSGKDLGLKVKSQSVNTDLPEQIFSIERLPSYKIIDIDDNG